ncbi:unnamed protein product [Leptidea sinapis]|uniref:G-protein coupled receptors family 1 profile domain-containing protein n=1 Tax=Leptidea sinapis TaxID=189913 RepID=A0A5E4QT47_9NEOP|nr:unnamed protein product [Leptidea sinapis]
MDVATVEFRCRYCLRAFAPLTLVPKLTSYNKTEEMQSLLDYSMNECPWYYFDSSYKTLLGGCLIVFGVFGVLLNGWLFATFLHSHLLIFRSHVLVLNLCSASLGRNLIRFPFAASSAIAKRWLYGTASCQLFAFLNQFLGVFQMTALFTLKN